MIITEVAREIKNALKGAKLDLYRPYGHPDTLVGKWSQKPWQLDFHQAGKSYKERMLCAANRVGKTECAAAEVAYHLTGLYPEWWAGKTFDEPVLVWTGSPTNETSRDIVQKALLGGTGEELGLGFIPKDTIIGKPKMRQAGVSEVVDSFKIRHVSGGVSTCIMKTYEQGWRKWQGTEPQVVWNDEEPEDYRIYTEALTRLLTSHGTMMVTFTPLLGQTRLVKHFMTDNVAGTFLETADWDDAPHLDEDAKEQLKGSYPEHEVQARTQGVPMLGAGAVWPYSEEGFICEPFEIPAHFSQIVGVDFGVHHPAAVSKCAWDRDNDIFYVCSTFKRKGTNPQSFCAAVYKAAHDQSSGVDFPVSWPHDGMNRDKSGSGPILIKKYREEDPRIRFLSKSARYVDDTGGSQSVERIVGEIDVRIQTGKLKVFSTCREFLEEYRSYHRYPEGHAREGQIVDANDDVIKSVMYAHMMRRYSRTKFMKRKSRNTGAALSARIG